MSTMTTQDYYDEIKSDSDAWTYAETAERYAYTLPENAKSFESIADMRRQVVASGSHYFDRDAIRFFRARTDGHLYGHRFWVESRQFVDLNGDADPREYMIAWVSEYNGSLSIEKRGSFDTLEKARTAARHLARLLGE